MSSNSPIQAIANNYISFLSTRPSQSQIFEDSEAPNPYTPTFKGRVLLNITVDSEPFSECASLLSESGNQGEAANVNETLKCVSIEDIFPPNNNEVLLGSVKQSIDIEQMVDKKIEL